jgi:hypothetical protein
LTWQYVNETHINMVVVRKYNTTVNDKFVAKVVRLIKTLLKYRMRT